MSPSRWYDQSPPCAKLLKELQAIEQPVILEFCARIIINFAERLKKEIQSRERNTVGLNQIGVSAISGLYRFGSEKRRWYDNNEVLHKAVGLLYTQTLEGLNTISHKLGDTVGLLRVYSQVCTELSAPVVTDNMTRIAMTGLQTGNEEAARILIDIVGAEAYTRLTRP